MVIKLEARIKLLEEQLMAEQENINKISREKEKEKENSIQELKNKILILKQKLKTAQDTLDENSREYDDKILILKNKLQRGPIVSANSSQSQEMETLKKQAEIYSNNNVLLTEELGKANTEFTKLQNESSEVIKKLRRQVEMLNFEINRLNEYIGSNINEQEQKLLNASINELEIERQHLAERLREREIEVLRLQEEHNVKALAGELVISMNLNQELGDENIRLRQRIRELILS